MAKAKVGYDEKTIQTLDALEHIRLRTGMYIGRLGDRTAITPTSAAMRKVVFTLSVKLC